MNQKQWDSLADHYHDEIISPYYAGVKNPLFSELKKIKDKKKKSVAEFGCGMLYLGSYLSEEFKTVHASDFSSEMVRKAKKSSSGFPNISIKKEDITKLPHSSAFDVVLSINSLLMPSFEQVKLGLQNLYKSLKKGGSCFLIVPSMESVLYHNMLMLDKELHAKEEKNAVRAAKRKTDHDRYDYFLGHYKDASERQKFFYEHEIRFFLKQCGFTDIKIKKVIYPWGEASGDYQDFPDEDPLWDWFVSCRK